jgi:hypothetical protein
VPSQVFLHGDGFSRAYVGAETAALTGDSVYPEVHNCFEAAELLTQAAPRAFLFINKSNLPAPEFMLLTHDWLE